MSNLSIVPNNALDIAADKLIEALMPVLAIVDPKEESTHVTIHAGGEITIHNEDKVIYTIPTK